MGACSENRNPLTRTGTGQDQRSIQALNPDSAPVMDKAVQDWMVWASKFSDHLNFTAEDLTHAGTMQPFFADNPSARMAMATSYDLNDLITGIREQLNFIEKEDDGLKQYYTTLFNIVFSYSFITDQLYLKTKDDREFNTVLRNHIQARILPVEQRAISYFKASREGTPAQQLISASPQSNTDIFNQGLIFYEDLAGLGLSAMEDTRYDSNLTFADYFGSIAADPTIFGTITGVNNKIKYIAQHNFFTGILEAVIASASFIKRHCEKYLQRYLTDWPNHQPNYALYLTWLSLLKDSKAHLNGLTGRHLDFYYKKVLQLKPQPQVADTAFLSIELSKPTTTFALKKDTRFIGPKDDEGALIHFQTTRETVLNKAQIKHVSALYYADSNDNIGGQINAGHLYAAPVINSADGLGEDLDEQTIGWHPFHNKAVSNGNLTAINMPKATIGFALSSHYLRLNEGLRVITLDLVVQQDISLTGFQYEAFITTEKKWLELENPLPTKSAVAGGTKLSFSFTVSGDKEPITPYDPSVHLGTMTASEPVIKLVLKPVNAAFIYDQWSNLNLRSIDLSVRVGELNGVYNDQGVKRLDIHNNSSALDPAKPFNPWGAEPTIGNAFVIGSQEVFYKKGARLQLNFKWKDLPLTSTGAIDTSALDFDGYSDVSYRSFNSVAGPATPDVQIQKLKANSWQIHQDNANVFMNASNVIADTVAYTVDLNGDDSFFLEKDEAWSSYNINANKGFLKIRLKNDFGHRDYYNALQNFAKINDDNDNPPVYPYQPTLESFSISYEASCSIDLTTSTSFEQRVIEFFHLGPFGDAEQHLNLQGVQPKLLNRLIAKTAGVYKAQGSLFLGFEHLQPGDTQSVLFQLQEGSEAPLLEKPEEHLQWEYLKAEGVWQALHKDFVGDNTKGFIESGLINFVIPEDAALTHTQMPSNLIWLRCQVTQATDAVCKIIGIHTNTVAVERVLPNGKLYPEMISPAGSIKKLWQPESAVKSIVQHYTSYRGRAKEQSEAFYLRVSERLRHKDRAITIWDYERLILQEFPEIYRAKCLNHTQIEGSATAGVSLYNELAPGHVSIVTIPDLKQRNDIEPLKPYTKKSTHARIEEFLRARTSCQVKLHLAQPEFEEVKVKCNVTLRKEFQDVNYYMEQIQEAIMHFLSPWAFSADADLNFGGSIHESVLIDFIEELPYVDYLTDFVLTLISSAGPQQLNEAIATTARSVLVSVPASEHQITVLLQPEISNPEPVCEDE